MKTCLIVDDSKVIRSLAGRMVSGLGFEIVEAADGEQALAACGRHMPDAILLDWNMPVMNGIEFLQLLPSVAGEPRPVVIFCTTETSLDHIESALKAGAHEYIMKPFDKDILESKFVQVGLLS